MKILGGSIFLDGLKQPVDAYADLGQTAMEMGVIENFQHMGYTRSNGVNLATRYKDLSERIDLLERILGMKKKAR